MRQAKLCLITATLLLCSITRLSGEIILTQSDGLLSTVTNNSAGVPQYVYASPVFTLEEATNTLVFTFLETHTTTASLNDTNGYPFVALAEFYLYDGNGNEIALSQSNFSTNAQEPTEGAIGNICDKNLNTYFHSMWSTGASDYHNIIVTLPEGISLKDFKFKYITRYTLQCVPKRISIKTGNDLLAKGTYGENLTWQLTYGGHLSITGSGPIGTTEDYMYEVMPWHDYEYYNILKKVTIGEGITSIGNGTFQARPYITSASLPGSLETIGTNAFRGTGITSIYIPQGVKEINESAFVGCSLTSIVVDEKNPVYDSRKNCNAIIKTAENELICGCSTTIIPEGIEAIGFYAFDDCDALESIAIPQSVGIIYSNSFAYCNNLESIVVDSENPIYDSRNDCNAIIETSTNTLVRGTGSTIIPESITAIGGQAFSECEALTSLIIPEGVSTIGFGAFNYCQNLTSINLPQGITSIEYGVFAGCSSLESIDIPQGVTSIGYSAFEYCSALTTVSIPAGVTSIEFNTFCGCSALTSVIIPEGVTSIGFDAFASCSALTSMSIPEGLTSIDDWAFWNCTSLRTLTLSQTINNIGSYAFADCSALTSVSIPEGVTEIKNATFARCYKLSSVSLPKSLKTIGDNAFNNCKNLKKLTIPENVDSIGIQAFLHCHALQSLVLPNSVEYVGDYAFQSCQGLTSLTISENLDTISNYAFSICPKLKEVTIPHSVTHIGEGAFWDCGYLRKVNIGKNVETIDYYAFADNTALTEINSFAVAPPVLFGDAVFGNVNKYSCKLNVPTGSLIAYQNTFGWREFYYIAESDELSAVEHINASERPAWPADIYDLNGCIVRVNAYSTEGLSNGIYMINGRKVVVK